MAGLSEEQGRALLAEITFLREALDVAVMGLDVYAGERADVTKQVRAARDRGGMVAAGLQTMLGPEDRGPAEVLELPKRKKGGAHRA
jgi:hypothetical protein